MKKSEQKPSASQVLWLHGAGQENVHCAAAKHAVCARRRPRRRHLTALHATPTAPPPPPHLVLQLREWHTVASAGARRLVRLLRLEPIPCRHEPNARAGHAIDSTRCPM